MTQRYELAQSDFMGCGVKGELQDTAEALSFLDVASNADVTMVTPIGSPSIFQCNVAICGRVAHSQNAMMLAFCIRTETFQ